MTSAEALAYLEEHVLSERQQQVCAVIMDVLGLCDVPEGSLSLYPIVAHLLTEMVCAHIDDTCGRDAQRCAEMSVLVIRHVEALLMAKVLLLYH